MPEIQNSDVAEADTSCQQTIKMILSKVGKQDQYEKVMNSYRTIISNDKIISLDLIGLGIQKIDKDIFRDLTSISQLYLSWNKIDDLPLGVFDHLPTLQYLDLRGSGLSKIETGIFDKLRNLQRLELNDNKLKSIPSNIFDQLLSLREINLSNNEIEILDAKIFDSLRNLERLYLYFNPLPGDISFGNYYDQESVEELISLLKSHFNE